MYDCRKGQDIAWSSKKHAFPAKHKQKRAILVFQLNWRRHYFLFTPQRLGGIIISIIPKV